jgi:hypothetical protein
MYIGHVNEWANCLIHGLSERGSVVGIKIPNRFTETCLECDW